MHFYKNATERKMMASSGLFTISKMKVHSAFSNQILISPTSITEIYMWNQ